MRRLTLLLMLLTGSSVLAQTTTVTGIVSDANGNAYFPGTISAAIQLNSGQALPAGVPASGSIGPFATTSGGNFSVIVASPLTWVFTICGTPKDIGPLKNSTPVQVCFSTTPIAISGVSQVITSNLPTIPLLGPIGSSGGGSITDLITKNTPVIDVRAYGAKGDGATDDTVAIQAAMNVCGASSTGGTVLMPHTAAGYVVTRGVTAGRLGAANQQGGINGYPGCSLLGNNTKLILRSNNAFIFYDPEIVSTLTISTITADTIVGQTNFTVNSSAGFVVGDDVYFRLGADTTNPPEASYFGFAKVSVIPDGTHLTLDRPLNNAMTVASTLAYDRQIFKSSLGFPQNIEIGGFQLFTDQANGGNAEYGVLCAYCRNVHIHDIQAIDPGAGAAFTQFVDNVSVDNVNVLSSFAFAQASKGVGVGCAECTNVTYNNVRIANFDHNAVNTEAYSKNIKFNNLQTINNTTASQTTVNEITTGQGCEVHVDGWRIEGLASNQIVNNSSTSGNVWAGNVNVNVSGGMSAIPQNTLAAMWGKFVWTNGNANVSTLYGTYSAPRWWSGQLPLAASATSVLNLPDGIYKKARVFASSATGITGTFVTCCSSLHNSPDLTASLSAGNTVDITSASVVGIFAGAGSPNTWTLTGKQLQIFTNGSVPVGAYLTVWIEYYPLDGASSTLTAAAQDTTQNVVAKQVSIIATPFASLGTPSNGTFYYCSDCTIANPCASGGTGALAKRLNGVWVCN